MDKDMRLVNIYIKIHNKETLTLDDLQYLAAYNPECFRKTCDNLVYNLPQSKPLLDSDPLLKKNRRTVETKTEQPISKEPVFKEPMLKETVSSEAASQEPAPKEVTNSEEKVYNPFEPTEEEMQMRELFISEFLQNLRKMENSEVNVVQNVDLEEVKDLVGNLYMEMLFPHSGMPRFFEMYEKDDAPSFDRLA